MGNTHCTTCFDRLGHGRPYGPLIRARRPRNIDAPDSDMSEVIVTNDDSYVRSTTEMKERVSRRRPSVNPAALKRQQASTAEEEEYSEEEEHDEVVS